MLGLAEAVVETIHQVAHQVGAGLGHTALRRQELAKQATALRDGPIIVKRFDWRAVERQARQKLDDWRGLLTRQVSEGRQVLKQLLTAGPIQFTPFREDKRRGYRFTGNAMIAGLLEGVVEMTNGNWRPHWDSAAFTGFKAVPGRRHEPSPRAPTEDAG